MAVHSVSESIPSGPSRLPEEWDELFDSDGKPREVYRPLFNRLDLPRMELRRLGEQLEATMREMGVTFDIVRDCPWGRRPWFCDLAPQIFTADEWKPLDAGVKQRVHAYECFLRDIYGEARILRQGTVPVQQVLGSAHYQRAACGLPVPEGAYLHLAGIAVGREPDGRLVVKHHYFSHASGISYMIQNRRALARVIPQSFQDYSLHSISDTPTDILEQLRCLSADSDPMVVLLSPGQGSAVYSEHSFLARRMGIPLVQGGDLLVHNDHVYLKTVSGLERVHAIYNRIADQWL
ncbi:MAG: circularly permuted type 2 ATP-grasp protein, partial [Chthoniobacterales bacterium]